MVGHKILDLAIMVRIHGGQPMFLKSELFAEFTLWIISMLSSFDCFI